MNSHIQEKHDRNESHCCNYCNRKFSNETSLTEHKDAHHQFNCLECDHQAHNEVDLIKHMDIAHKASLSEIPEGMEYKCASCAQYFAKKDSLMCRRRDTHGKSQTKCLYNIPPSVCKKGDKECAFDHTPDSNKPSEFTCTVCKELFSTKSQVLNHRKTSHPEKVPMCRSFKEGVICPFSPCRYNHESPNEEQMPPAHVNYNGSVFTGRETTGETNFWMAPKTINPGEQIKELKSMIESMMKDICSLKESNQKKN